MWLLQSGDFVSYFPVSHCTKHGTWTWSTVCFVLLLLTLVHCFYIWISPAKPASSVWQMRRKHKFSSFYLYNTDFISVLLKENFLWDIMKSQFKCYFFKYKFIYFIYLLILAALGLRCCMRAFSRCGERGLLFIVVRGLLIAVASLVVEHGLQARGLQQLWHSGSVVVARGLQSAGSAVVVHGLSCSAARGIFPDQGSNMCPLHWQVDSQPLRHHGIS